MPDILPELKRNGEWIEPLREAYTPGLAFGVGLSDVTLPGVPFTTAPRQGETRRHAFSVGFYGPDEIRWWAWWYYNATRFGARRWAARLLLPEGWRTCVCQFLAPPEQLENTGLWLKIGFDVEIVNISES